VAPPPQLSHPLSSARALGQSETGGTEDEPAESFGSLIGELMVFKTATKLQLLALPSFPSVCLQERVNILSVRVFGLFF